MKRPFHRHLPAILGLICGLSAGLLVGYLGWIAGSSTSSSTAAVAFLFMPVYAFAAFVVGAVFGIIMGGFINFLFFKDSRGIMGWFCFLTPIIFFALLIWLLLSMNTLEPEATQAVKAIKKAPAATVTTSTTRR